MHNICYGTALQHSNGIWTEKVKKCLSFFIQKECQFLHFSGMGSSVLVITVHSILTNKTTTVRTSVHSKTCWLCYVICYTTASVCTLTGTTVRWFATNRSGRPLFWVKLSTVETETVHATNVTDSAVLQTVTVAVRMVHKGAYNNECE